MSGVKLKALQGGFMKENFVQLVSLYDVYGDLLSKNEKESFEQYYCDDLSLSEIAENLGITRQGVRDNIQRAEKMLVSFDEKLHLRSKLDLVNGKINEAIRELENGNTDKALKILKETEL